MHKSKPVIASAAKQSILAYESSTYRLPQCKHMQFFRGYQHPGLAPACALTIGNFDGVHRGHQAMLALLRSEAQQRGVPSCVLTFEPHPRDYFALHLHKPELAPSRVGTFRDK